MFGKKELCLYFKRVGLDYTDFENTPRDGEMLKKLQYAHVVSVPYENLDILEGRLLDLSVPAMFDKIVVRHRGGYCFELNGLYGALLRSLGFGVTDCFARYLRGENGIPMRRHRVLKTVTSSGEVWLCDAGVGERAPREALRLEEGLVQRQYGEVYRFLKEDFLGWVLYDLYKGEWRRFFSFTEEPQLDIDYAAASAWCELHPASPFNKQYMLSIKTRSGRVTLDGRTLKIFDGDFVTVRENLDDMQIEDAMKTYFGIVRQV